MAVSECFCSPDFRHIYFSAEQGVGSVLYRMDRQDGNFKKLSGGFTDSSFSVSPDGRKIAFIRSASHLPPEIYIMSSDGGNARRISFLNEKLRKFLVPAESSVFEGYGRLSVEGMLIRPLQRTPSAGAPMLVMIHGGTG